MSDIHNIVENIERSVLVLGPGIVLDKDGKSLLASFADRYSQRNKGLIKYYFEYDNLIRPKNASTRIAIQKNFADFYEKEFLENVKDLYKRISQIPYPLIISLNPDNTMTKCFDEIGSKHTFDFYIKGKKNLINEIPTRDNPYLFNLLGCYLEPESLILTYDDLFDYLRNILPGDGLPTAIRSTLRNAVNITFLGVEFDKWYFQLLVKLLTEFDEKFELLRNAAPDLLENENIKNICENNFEITFVGPDVVNFIKELYYHFYKHKENTLRGKIFLSSVRAFNPEIFVSYKHTGESVNLAARLFECGKENRYNITYDRGNLEYKGRTWEFLKRIGWGKYIIIIINDDYIKSEYCMLEFMEIIHSSGKLEDRVFPIVMDDVDIYTDINRKKYDEYWRKETQMLKTGLSEMGSEELLNRLEMIRKYEKIVKSIPMLMDFLDKRNIMTLQKLQDENFISLFISIDKKIQEDLSIV